MNDELIKIKELVDELEDLKDPERVIDAIKHIHHSANLYQEDFLLNDFRFGDEVEYCHMKGVILGIDRDALVPVVYAMFRRPNSNTAMTVYDLSGEEIADIHKTGKCYDNLEEYFNERLYNK